MTFNVGENRKVVKTVQIDENTWVVMGNEPFRQERFGYCTWIGNRYGLESGHYSMSKEEAEEDFNDRVRKGY